MLSVLICAIQIPFSATGHYINMEDSLAQKTSIPCRYLGEGMQLSFDFLGLQGGIWQYVNRDGNSRPETLVA